MSGPYFRSYNPIWDFRSLTGLPLDDNSYAYFLTDTIPYVPQAVYHTSTGTEWNNPVQLSAAGTLQNIFCDPNLVYRIEIRTNDGISPVSQSDALVWLIENYVPDGPTTGPTPTVATLSSSNQITNPQFALLNFNSPITLSGITNQTIAIAPGWDLVLAGTGDVTLTQQPLTSTTSITTDAPYALEINLSSWTTVYLRQRFNTNGILWSNKYVSASITGRIEGVPQNITATLVDSQSHLLGTIITSTALTSAYQEIRGHALIGDSSNTDSPPDAYIEFRINLPGSADIFLTSIQVISSSSDVEISYEQTTVERQTDQTFHVYKDSLLTQSPHNILTGWDFPVNPWQFGSTSLTNLASTGEYVTDQTIVITQEADSVQVGRASDPLGYFQIDSRIGQTQGKIAVIQYIDPKQCSSNWGDVVSALVQMKFTTSASTTAKIKMRLIYSTTLPTTVDPIASWGSTDPTFTAQWTALTPLNDPEYTLSSTVTDFSFNEFSSTPNIGGVLPSLTGATATLGVVLYTTTNLASASTDSLLIKKVSLVQKDYGVEATPLSYDETLSRCEFYYEKSYDSGTAAGTVTNVGQIATAQFPVTVATGPVESRLLRFPFSILFRNVKRTSAPTLTIYSPGMATAGKVLMEWRDANTLLNSDTLDISTYAQQALSSKAVTYNSDDNTNFFGDQTYNAGSYGITIVQYTCDARLGLVA